MIVLDFFIVNVALPSMRVRLHASQSSLEWVVAGYSLAFSTVLVTASRAGDRFGRRFVLGIGLALFAASSAACGLAPTAGALVACRIVQGVSGGLVMPTVMAILGTLYEGEARVRAISVNATVMGVAAASGQLIGGALIRIAPAGVGWRLVFLINVPVAAAALATLRRRLPETRVDSAPGLDPIGTTLLTAALTSLVLPLIEGRQLGWPTWTEATLAASPALLGLFLWYERRLRCIGGTPLIDLRLFGSRVVAAGLLIQLALWCGQASFFLVLALFLQEGRGMGALEAGLVFGAVSLPYLATSLRAPVLMAHRGARSVIGGGALVLAAGHALLAVAGLAGGAHAPLAAFVPGMALVGAGMGLCISPVAAAVLSGISPMEVGAASGVLSTVQQVGNSVGVALTGIIFFASVESGYGRAFSWSVLELSAILIGVSALSRLLPNASDTH